VDEKCGGRWSIDGQRPFRLYGDVGSPLEVSVSDTGMDEVVVDDVAKVMAETTARKLMLSLDGGLDDPTMDLATVFGNDQRVEIEVGIGKGRFLLDSAWTHQDVNYIGIEVAAKYLRLAHDRADRRGLENLRFVHGDAHEFIEFFIPTASIHAFHIYFPDPWPKKRHHKRRLVVGGFVEQVLRVLVPGGRVWLKTDHADYFEAMLEALGPFADRLIPVEAAWTGAPTNFEIKYVTDGRPIHRRVLEKV
jgi:tRNA (guanine-N7-)-methyltransferase